MTLRCAVHATLDENLASDESGGVAVIERNLPLAPETLGLTLTEGHALLHNIQAQLVTAQVAAWQAGRRPCPGCGEPRRLKDRRPIVMRTIFGTQAIVAERLRRCGCGDDPGAGATVTPLAELLIQRTSPELLYLETRWGSLMSYGLAARMLGELLPLDRPINAERVRRDLYAEAAREEADLGPEEQVFFDGCQLDLFDMPLPDGPMVVGIDGGYVRDRDGSWFEVIAGKGLTSFRRDAASDPDAVVPAPSPPGRCFAFVQALDDRPRRRMFEMLRSQGYQPNQKLVFLTDGGESVRKLQRRISPEAEHVLDWFHIAMRLTVLGQMAKGAAPDDDWREKSARDLDRLRQLLWHGHVREAADQASWIEEDTEVAIDEASNVAKTKLKKLSTALAEFGVYVSCNAGSIVDYGERYRVGERISSGFVESAINQIVAKRFSKRQSMRWTKRGAHFQLQTRTRVLNDELEGVFRKRWPEFRPARAA